MDNNSDDIFLFLISSLAIAIFMAIYMIIGKKHVKVLKKLLSRLGIKEDFHPAITMAVLFPPFFAILFVILYFLVVKR